MRLTATFMGRQPGGHYVLEDVQGDVWRSHFWINCRHNRFPDIPRGSIIQFSADSFMTESGIKLTDIHDVEVIA